MKSINPYINFNGNCEEAFEFYQSVFGGKLQLVRYGELENNMGLEGDDLNQIGNVALPIIGDTFLYGSDVPKAFGQPVEAGTNHEINIEAENIEETKQLFEKLSDEGNVKMPLQETEWAERFGSLTDKFGVQWMVMYSGDKS